MFSWIVVSLSLVVPALCYPICPKRTRTSGQPKFTKRLGDFDYVAMGKSVAIQCCNNGAGAIKWYRQGDGFWESYPPDPVPGMTDIPTLEEDNQILRIFDAEKADDTVFKCELIEGSSTDLFEVPTIQHEMRLNVVACDRLGRGPIMTKPFPKDQYIEKYGGNISLACSGYFGCSEDGVIDGGADWLVKEKGRYKPASHVSQRYNVAKYTNDGKTILGADLSISSVSEEDVSRLFICKLSSAQVYESQSNQTVRIYKKDKVNIDLWVGVAVGAMVILVMVIIILKFVIGKLWGPQIKWYFRSRMPFIGPEPVADKKFSAFMYHADDDVKIANNVKDKLEDQNFRIFLSSEVQGFQRTLPAYEEKCNESAVVIFLYTKNLWEDPMANFFLLSVVEFRQGKGILFLEVEEYSAAKVMEWTKEAERSPDKRARNPLEASTSLEADCPNHDRIENAEDEKKEDARLDIKFWRALPRLKVPTDKSSTRKKKNFHCSIQNWLPLVKNQNKEHEYRLPSKRSSNGKSRHSSSAAKPLLGEAAELSSVINDDVFDSDQETKRFVFDNEAVSRNTSLQSSQDNREVIYSRSEAGVDQQPIRADVESQNEAAAAQAVLVVSADVHPHAEENESRAEVEIINEFDSTGRLKIDSSNSEEPMSPSEQGVFTLSGEETEEIPRKTELPNADNLADDKSEKLESGFSDGNFSPGQSGSSVVSSSGVSSSLSNGLRTGTSSGSSVSPNHAFQNGANIPVVTNGPHNEIPVSKNDSYTSSHESGYNTSPMTGLTRKHCSQRILKQTADGSNLAQTSINAQ